MQARSHWGVWAWAPKFVVCLPQNSNKYHFSSYHCARKQSLQRPPKFVPFASPIGGATGYAGYALYAM